MERYVEIKEKKASRIVYTNEAGARAMSLASGLDYVKMNDQLFNFGDEWNYEEQAFYRNGVRVPTPIDLERQEHERQMNEMLNESAEVVQKLYELDRQIINNLE